VPETQNPDNQDPNSQNPDSQDPIPIDSPQIPSTPETPNNELSTPAAILDIQRKRARGRDESSKGTNKRRQGEEMIEGFKGIVEARHETAVFAARSSIDKVTEAIDVLLRDFTGEPTKTLTPEDMQIAIEFLSSPDKAAVFLCLSKGQMEHRNGWLEKQAGVSIC